MSRLEFNFTSLTRLAPHELLAWASKQARVMRDCAQDKNWHAEGDVWTHTEQVFRELEGIDGRDSLKSTQERS